MNFDDNITEVFDRYLTGQMTEVEERDFAEQLKNDPSLKQSYETHRAIVAGIRDARKEELKDYIKKNAKIRYIGNVWSSKWVMTSAAVFIIFFTTFMVIEYGVNSSSKKNTTAQTEDNDSNEPVATEKDKSETALKNEEDGEATEMHEAIPDEVVEDNAENANSNVESYDGYDGLTPAEQKAVMPEIKKVVPIITKRAEIDLNKVSKNNNADATIDVYYEVATTTQYRYSNNKLILYKFPYEDDVVVYKTDDDTDYLAWQRAYYPLKKDDKAHPLQELKDKKILSQLPALK